MSSNILMDIDTNPAKIGRIYQLSSRNLGLGVWTGREFIGIRAKFGEEYLFGEYPATSDGRDMPYETVRAWHDLGVDVPEKIKLTEHLGTACSNCKKKAWWTGPPAPAPWTCESGCDSDKIHAHAVSNDELFNFLQEVGKEYNISNEEEIEAWNNYIKKIREIKNR